MSTDVCSNCGEQIGNMWPQYNSCMKCRSITYNSPEKIAARADHAEKLVEWNAKHKAYEAAYNDAKYSDNPVFPSPLTPPPMLKSTQILREARAKLAREYWSNKK